jgi:hypothetical protein
MKTYIKYGLILGAVLSAVPLILFALGMDKNDTIQKVSSFINITISAVVIFMGIKEERDIRRNGWITFGQGFSTGMMITLVGGIISAIFSFIYFSVINPGMITYIQMKQEEEMLNRGMSQDQVDKMASNMEMWSSPTAMAAFTFVGMLLIGLVICLISSGILKREDPAAQIS